MTKFAVSASILGLAGMAILAGPAAADPPADARPLSQIAQALEKVPGYLFLQELKWDENAGAWTAIYRTVNGMDKHILVHAQTGAISEPAPSGAGEDPKPNGLE
ncbi:hypothetical protein [Notoacmeibacter marinus]|uniref:hypothetical protein n=1 Tax=Notoacmeibacter marinus TaxID=1876515 RepID=UPI000DF26058|nr:hypothetical protein [Notoacmeibacter marinus]